MKYYDLLKDAPFEKLDIPAPEKLETTEDYSLLTQHMVSEFYPALNLCYARHGYAARQQMLAMMVLFLSEIMPVRFPQHIRNYPASLNDIYTFLGGLIIAPDDMRVEKAG